MQINEPFPIEYIEAFGAGTVGPIHIAFNDEGKIILAVAELYEATFERMLIDDPNILRIFGKDGSTINMDVLHPWPKFRLFPLGPISDEDSEVNEFEVGRLTDVTHKPRSWTPLRDPTPLTKDSYKEGAVYKSILQRVFTPKVKKVLKRGKSHTPKNFHILRPGLPLTSIPDRKGRFSVIPPEGISGRIAARLSSPDIGTPSPIVERSESPTSQPSSVSPPPVHKTPVLLPQDKVTGHTPSLEPTTAPPKPRHRFTNMIPNGPHRAKVQNVVDEIFSRLPDAATRELYNHYGVVVRKEVANDPARKTRFHEDLYKFVERHNIVELHNQYAKLTRSGTNRIYQLPTFAVEG